MRWPQRGKEARIAELAIIISYPKSASGIIVLLKTHTKYRKFLQTLFVETSDFQLVFNFEQTRTVTIFGEHGTMAHISGALIGLAIMVYTMMAKPIIALELHYPMIQFLIIIKVRCNVYPIYLNTAPSHGVK